MTEVSSPPRLVPRAAKAGLYGGYNFDLETGWDVNDPKDVDRLWQHLKNDGPALRHHEPAVPEAVRHASVHAGGEAEEHPRASGASGVVQELGGLRCEDRCIPASTLTPLRFRVAGKESRSQDIWHGVVARAAKGVLRRRDRVRVWIEVPGYSEAAVQDLGVRDVVSEVGVRSQPSMCWRS